jgi:hypothetical protein
MKIDISVQIETLDLDSDRDTTPNIVAASFIEAGLKSLDLRRKAISKPATCVLTKHRTFTVSEKTS